MKPFTMHPVLKYRQQLEDSARQDLYEAQEQETQAMTRLQQTTTAIETLYSNLQAERNLGTTPDRLALFEHRIEQIKIEREQDLEALQKAQELVMVRRQRLLTASRDRKVLEKLKEQQDKSYKKHLDKKEAIMLDELAVLHHKR